MPTTQLNQERCQKLFNENVKPIFKGHPHQPVLDRRIWFYLQLADETGALQPGSHLLDLGPGLCIFGPVVKQLGLRVTMIDDFGGGGGVRIEQRGEDTRILKDFRERLGINIIEENFLEHPLPLETGSVDIITCFHSLEHWHHSPKRLFKEISRVLRPGGFLILVTPNAVNIRKRVFGLIGKNHFPSLHEWYVEGDPVFRGHVREPVVRDLHQLLEWNGFEVISTYGRNFIGRDSHALAFLPKPIVRGLAGGSDVFLRFFPSLCSDIHVTGRKQV